MGWGGVDWHGWSAFLHLSLDALHRRPSRYVRGFGWWSYSYRCWPDSLPHVVLDRIHILGNNASGVWTGFPILVVYCIVTLPYTGSSSYYRHMMNYPESLASQTFNVRYLYRRISHPSKHGLRHWSRKARTAKRRYMSRSSSVEYLGWLGSQFLSLSNRI